MEVGRREAERITGYKAGRYAESATERNAEVRKVSTDAGALDKDFDCGRLGVAAATAVFDVLIGKFQPFGRRFSDVGPY